MRPCPGRVLVVEDDDDIRESISDCLALQGYAVHLARNGLEALERLRESRPDVILLDLMMPVMDGRAFLRAIRADASLAHIPVVVVSAASDVDLEPEVRLLEKPFEMEALFGVLERAAHPHDAPAAPPG